MSLSNLKISGKLTAAFALILSVFVVQSVVLFGSMNTTLDMARKNNVSYLNSRDVNGVLQNAVEQQNAVRAFAATTDPKFLENYEKYGAQLDGQPDARAGRELVAVHPGQKAGGDPGAQHLAGLVAVERVRARRLAEDVDPPGERCARGEHRPGDEVDVLAARRVEIPRRLVGEENRGSIGEGARNRDALLLAA